MRRYIPKWLHDWAFRYTEPKLKNPEIDIIRDLEESNIPIVEDAFGRVEKINIKHLNTIYYQIDILYKDGSMRSFHGWSGYWDELPSMERAKQSQCSFLKKQLVYFQSYGGPWPTAHLKKKGN